MPRLLLAPSAPSLPTPEPLAKSGLNSTASITASSMTLTHSSRRSASSPLHDNTAQREQNPHSGHYNGLTPRLGADDVAEQIPLALGEPYHLELLDRREIG